MERYGVVAKVSGSRVADIRTHNQKAKSPEGDVYLEIEPEFG